MNYATADAEIYVMIRVWAEDGKIRSETENIEINCAHELMFNLQSNYRPIRYWIEDALNEIWIEDYILPTRFEVCEEPILYECIGNFSITGEVDYWGEYDEEYDFELKEWSVDFEDEEDKKDKIFYF
jgi:hypothetical protein